MSTSSGDYARVNSLPVIRSFQRLKLRSVDCRNCVIIQLPIVRQQEYTQNTMSKDLKTIQNRKIRKAAEIRKARQVCTRQTPTDNLFSSTGKHLHGMSHSCFKFTRFAKTNGGNWWILLSDKFLNNTKTLATGQSHLAVCIRTVSPGLSHSWRYLAPSHPICWQPMIYKW